MANLLNGLFLGLAFWLALYKQYRLSLLCLVVAVGIDHVVLEKWF